MISLPTNTLIQTIEKWFNPVSFWIWHWWSGWGKYTTWVLIADLRLVKWFPCATPYQLKIIRLSTTPSSVSTSSFSSIKLLKGSGWRNLSIFTALSRLGIPFPKSVPILQLHSRFFLSYPLFFGNSGRFLSWNLVYSAISQCRRQPRPGERCCLVGPYRRLCFRHHFLKTIVGIAECNDARNIAPRNWAEKDPSSASHSADWVRAGPASLWHHCYYTPWGRHRDTQAVKHSLGFS